jgi:hypothetical protein
VIRTYQEEYRNLTKTLEGRGSDETFKSKTCLFPEDTRKELLIFQHPNMENPLLRVLKKHGKCPSVKTYFLTTESRGTLSLDYLTLNHQVIAAQIRPAFKRSRDC